VKRNACPSATPRRRTAILLPSTASRTTRLTASGSRFLSDRDGNENLWYVKADGTEPKQLTRDNRLAFRSPNWTPDSQYAIVSKTQQGTDVWMYHLRGGSGVNITGSAWEEQRRHRRLRVQVRRPTPVKYGAQLSPDGRYLLFSRKKAPGSVYNQVTFWMADRSPRHDHRRYRCHHAGRWRRDSSSDFRATESGSSTAHATSNKQDCAFAISITARIAG